MWMCNRAVVQGVVDVCCGRVTGQLCVVEVCCGCVTGLLCRVFWRCVVCRVLWICVVDV